MGRGHTHTTKSQHCPPFFSRSQFYSFTSFYVRCNINDIRDMRYSRCICDICTSICDICRATSFAASLFAQAVRAVPELPAFCCHAHFIACLIQFKALFGIICPHKCRRSMKFNNQLQIFSISLSLSIVLLLTLSLLAPFYFGRLFHSR